MSLSTPVNKQRSCLVHNQKEECEHDQLQMPMWRQGKLPWAVGKILNFQDQK